LSEKVTVDDLFERMKDKRFRNRKWAILLLDQGFVAGIGNYLRSEIMFTSGIHPSLRPIDCPPDQLKIAAESIIHLVKQ
ncbi:endonuclease VIII, partial [Pseudoalteromonas sp. SIMBA_148]